MTSRSRNSRLELRRQVRRGATLIELLIVLTVIGVILTSSTVTLFRLLQAQSSGAESLARTLTLARLAADLRRDAHAATTAALANVADVQTLTLQAGPRGDVRYAAEENGLTRFATAADGVPTRETYDCGDAVPQWELQQAGRLIALHLHPAPPPSNSAGPAAAPEGSPSRPALTILAALPPVEPPPDPP